MAPERPKTTGVTSSAGGPNYVYRGAQIVSNEKQTNFSFRLEGFPGPNGGWSGLGNLDVIVRVVDAWLDTGRLPPPYKTPTQV